MSPQLQPDGQPVVRPARPLAGLLTIFFAPAETFDSAGPRPWLVPLIAAIVLSIVLNVMVVNVMGMGTIVRNQIESRPKLADQLGPEKVNEMVQNAENSTGRKVMTYLAGAIAIPVILLVVAGITYGALSATGAITRFSAAFGALAWATYAVLVITTIGSAVFLALTKDFTGVDPRGMLMFNVGAFLDKSTTSPVVRAAAGGIDLVQFWSMFLQTVGLKRLSQQVSTAQAAGVVITLYVVFVLAKVGWAAIFG